MCVCALTADSGRSPVYRDPVLAALVRVGGDAGAQTLAVAPSVAVAGVCQAVFIKPGHVHLGGGEGLSEISHTSEHRTIQQGQDTKCLLRLIYIPIQSMTVIIIT